MRSTPVKYSFNTGEVSETMYGRLGDFDRMKSAMTKSFNGIPMVQGPWTRRPGTGFCDEVRYSEKFTRAVRFKYSTLQSYVIEFGDQYVRFKKNRAPVYDIELTITGVSLGMPTIVTYTGTDPSNGDDLDFSEVVGTTQLNGRRFRVANVDAGANTFQLTENDGSVVDGGAFGAYVSGGKAKRVYTLATPYLEDDLPRLKFSRSGDKLYVFHPDYPEATLNRFADANWTHTPITFLDGPYLPMNKTDTTFAVDNATPGAGRTLTASSIVGINDDTGFQTTDVGRLVRFKSSTNAWGYGRITARTSTTVVTITIINTFTNTNAVKTWRLGLLSDTTGYSAAGTFAGGRFIIGGCPYREARWDASYADDISNFAETEVDGTVTDAHSFPYTLTSEESQAIRWLKSVANGIIIGTFEGEWLARPSVNAEAMTPTNKDAKESTSHGSQDIDAIKVGAAVLFAQKYGLRLGEAVYAFNENQLIVTDATILADHIAKGDLGSGITELAFQRERIPIVWACRRDGALIGMTYSQEDKVAAWHHHFLGGTSDIVGSPAAVESITTIPSVTGEYEELWMVVRRWINGRTVRYNEFLYKTWEKGDSTLTSHFLDCSRTYSGAATRTITGLAHLRGETLSVLVNGATHIDVVVSQTGAITLEYDAIDAVVGYGYNSDGEILPFDSGSADGSAQGKIQRKHHVTFRVMQTAGLQAGPSFDKLQLITTRRPAHGSNTRTPLYTGLLEIHGWPGDASKEDRLCFRFNQPLPGTVCAVIARMDTADA